jgi:hypothetical protein
MIILNIGHPPKPIVFHSFHKKMGKNHGASPNLVAGLNIESGSIIEVSRRIGGTIHFTLFLPILKHLFSPSQTESRFSIGIVYVMFPSWCDGVCIFRGWDIGMPHWLRLRQSLAGLGGCRGAAFKGCGFNKPRCTQMPK